jgi:raffinose/stachyose/melibiose transport system substrate-binding protein
MKKSSCVIAVCAIFAFLFGACSRKDTPSVYLLNFKAEIQSQWEQVAKEFTGETGIPMKVVTAASGTYEQTLRSEISKSEPPTLFNINGPIGYMTWKEYCADLSGSQFYSWLMDKSMAISSGGGVYGIPYAVETYGIIYNDAIMRKYFALPNKGVSFSSMSQIKNFADFKALVEDMTARKSDLGIGGVFASTSFAPGEDWRWQTHLANLPIYYEYRDKNAGDLDQIQLTYSKNYQNIFDLYINNSITGPKMLGAKTVGDSMSEFATAQVAMVQNGNWAWGQISGDQGNKVAAEDIKFFPIYTGVPGEEKQGLCTGTENFICVNSKATAADQEASLKLLEWLFGSEAGKKNVKDVLGFVAPFSTFGVNERPSDPLVLEMFRYLDDSSLASVSWNFTTFPSQEFKNELGANLAAYAQGSKSWNDLAQAMIKSWGSEKAALQ